MKMALVADTALNHHSLTHYIQDGLYVRYGEVGSQTAISGVCLEWLSCHSCEATIGQDFMACVNDIYGWGVRVLTWRRT